MVASTMKCKVARRRHGRGGSVTLLLAPPLVVLLAVYLLVVAVVPTTRAFQAVPYSSRSSKGSTLSPASPSTTSFLLLSQQQQRQTSKLYIFGRDKDSKGDEDNENEKASASAATKEGGIPFFSRFLRKDEQEGMSKAKNDDDNSSAEPPAKTTTTAVLEKPAPSPPPPPEPKLKDLSPMEQAKMLRAQAEKARLEAERMDAQLTLSKITRLEKELAHAKKVASLTASSGTNSSTTAQQQQQEAEVESLMRELEVLQAKMRGETIKPVATATKPTTTKDASLKEKSKNNNGVKASSMSSVMPNATKQRDNPPRGDYLSRMPEFEEPFDEKVYQDVLNEVKSSPDFMKRAMALQVDVEYDDLDKLNVTEVALRLDKMSRFDFSFGGYERPSFTQSDIDEMKMNLKESGWVNGLTVDPRLEKLSDGNETEWALLALEYQYFMQKYAVKEEEMNEFVSQDEVFGVIMSQINVSAVDRTIDGFFPKCTRKEGQEPTEAQVQKLAAEVLPKAKFSSSAKPEKVAGGYIIRGTSRYKTGDELIEAIDKEIAKTSLGDKMTVLYTRDFTVFAFQDEPPDPAEMANIEPILYITGPDIVREPRRGWLGLTSALGLATCWYLSLYPFLLNPTLASRVDEELAMVDAGMTPDLSWLTDLSIPLFATFITIMACHELGHRVTAAINGIKPTFPTFVPSIITGVTTTVTSFKEPPKNLQSMFDFSVAGPLTGMIASLLAVLIGLQLTVSADPGSLPALPLEILRQSSLGGGLVDAILGNGALSVPEGALGTRAVATMTIPLHPVAVAGYIGLIVNALNVLPIGTTDGGRMAQTLFGRFAKVAIGNFAMLATLAIGIGGSDLFLFYFAFCIAFQTGNEIPARNEVDDVDVSRIFVAVVAYLLALLSLIPLQ